MIHSKIEENLDLFEKLFNDGLSDYKIAKILGLNQATIFQFRKKHGYIRESLAAAKAKNISDVEMEVIIGSLLGDGNMRQAGRNASFCIGHGPKQKDYCHYKAELLKGLNAKFSYSKRKVPDKRNGKLYDTYWCRIGANPNFNSIYEEFYKNGKKHIPITLVNNYFSRLSLAILYMDDGNKTKNGYTIATMCFNREEINEFRAFLLRKFNLETSIFGDGRLYIMAKSSELFTELIKEYVIDSMQYKLHSSPCKTGLKRETPEKDNSLPSSNLNG